MGSLFISYRQENKAQLQRVRAFAKELRIALTPHGWNVVLDQFQPEQGPNDGWPLWSANQVRDSHRVLVVRTAEYVQCMLKKLPEHGGRGAAWEASAIYHELYQVAGSSAKFRGLFFPDDSLSAFPAEIAGMHCFTAGSHLAGILDWLGITLPKDDDPPAVLTWPPARADFAHDLADRREEFHFYQAMLAGQTRERILLLQAARNHGKSGLIREFATYADGHVASALTDLKGCADSASLHRELRAELLRAGLAVVQGAQNLAALLDAVEIAAQTRPVVLLLDTYEQAVPEVQKFLQGQLLAAVRRAEGLCVVLGGQSVPDHGKELWANHARRFDLGRLTDKQHWIDYARPRFPQLNEAHIAMCVHNCKGLPGDIATNLASFARLVGQPPASA